VGTELIIVFVNKNAKTKRYLSDLGLTDLGSTGKRVGAIMPDMATHFCDGSEHPLNADMLLLRDTEVGKESTEKEILSQEISLRDTVFVFYHRNSARLSNHIATINELCMNRQVRPVVDHSTHGPVYDALCTVASAVSKHDQGQYDAAMHLLRSLFAGEPLLEVALDVLHKCLTVEGAAEVCSELREGKSVELKQLAGRDVALTVDGRGGSEHTVWKVEDVVQALARRPDIDPAKRIAFSDELDNNYIRALSDLRDVLLSEMTP
jgi:hypothetical protein